MLSEINLLLQFSNANDDAAEASFVFRSQACGDEWIIDKNVRKSRQDNSIEKFLQVNEILNNVTHLPLFCLG